MSDLKQICTHFMSGNCKYGHTCTKIHVSPNTELLQEIEKKGPILCNFYPNCKFNSTDCKKLHVDYENEWEKEMIELRRIYLKIVNYNTNDSYKNNQIERAKFMVKHDLEMLKTTLACLTEYE